MLLTRSQATKQLMASQKFPTSSSNDMFFEDLFHQVPLENTFPFPSYTIHEIDHQDSYDQDSPTLEEFSQDTQEMDLMHWYIMKYPNQYILMLVNKCIELPHDFDVSQITQQSSSPPISSHHGPTHFHILIILPFLLKSPIPHPQHTYSSKFCQAPKNFNSHPTTRSFYPSPHISTPIPLNKTHTSKLQIPLNTIHTLQTSNPIPSTHQNFQTLYSSSHFQLSTTTTQSHKFFSKIHSKNQGHP